MAIDLSAAKGLRWLAIMAVCACCACTTTQTPNTYRSKGYVSEKVYGVKTSPRHAHGRNIRKGGGRYTVGKPYVVKGKLYSPKEDPSYDRNGVASWYGSAFHGRLTANGEVYDRDHLSAAHPTLPLPSYVRVTNLENGSSLIVRVNDRGPYHRGRIIDVSSKAADLLDLKHHGTAYVRVQYVGRAGSDGHDMPFLMASYVTKGDRLRDIKPEPDVTVASNQSTGDHLGSHSKFFSSSRANPAIKAMSASYQPGAIAAAAFQTFGQFVMLPEIGTTTFERTPEFAPSMPPQKYCLNKDSDDGERGSCEVQALPLPGVKRNVRLTVVVSVKRRRSRLRGHRRRGTAMVLPQSAQEAVTRHAHLRR
ncbi:septal ring lytic transglycosylase RlpA family protein [Rhizobium hidalgonense]|uniref:septal ring lytic transglycosylase RlpA family protein n=1 Tax=Rhizobium hidalgonense TaxID=1538159 RepID=UPI001FED02CD|nr:septal ring lytic transglycosylase RlpA family protein [Rhizobium hidalgonense]MDR9804876.1 septal ring lytic transglycosylase RlpA family protein [Rhizobium hidalgonense]